LAIDAKNVSMRRPASDQLANDTATAKCLARIGARLQRRLAGRVQDFEVLLREERPVLVLRGQANTYYVKQLAQHAVTEALSLPSRGNESEVSGAEGNGIARRDKSDALQLPTTGLRPVELSPGTAITE